MKRNVLNWLLAQVGQARHAIALTHNIDFLFVQGVLAPRLRGAGNPRLTIFADADCAAASWAEQGALIDGLGVRYRVVPVAMGPYRRFHPKALLLANRDRAAVAIGSGNLGHGGMAANREAWAFGVSDGEGGGLIAGLRAYLYGLVGRLPIAEPLREALDVAFDPDQSWPGELPAASGLVAAPADRPILDRLLDLAGPSVRRVSVIAPYHDPGGEALAQIAARAGAPVTCWVQRGREGLSRAAAAGLPASVSLQSFRVGGDRPSFVHAKLIAFHREADVLLAVGSANCSRAALLADQSWGNAELMAVDAISQTAWAELISDLEPLEAAPQLPDAPPSDEWEEQPAPALRILAARQSAGALEIAFHAGEGLAQIEAETDGGSWPIPAGEVVAGRARLAAPARAAQVRLRGRSSDGAVVVSAWCWVDDEGSLSQPATFRRIVRRLADPEDGPADPSERFAGILDLFRDYIRDPEAARRSVRARPQPAPSGGGAYDPVAVFSDGFGRPARVSGLLGAEGEEHGAFDLLSVIQSLFHLSREAPPPPATPEEPEPELDPETGEPIEAPPPPPRPTAPAPTERARRRLRAALRSVEQALIDPDFVLARQPALLGRDLSLAAVLLAAGAAEGLLDKEELQGPTRSIWKAMLFGAAPGALGALPARAAGLDPEERAAFQAAVAGPELSAALALWASLASSGQEEASWFRLSAAQLSERDPWLFRGGPPEEVLAQLDRIAAALRLAAPARQAAIGSWVWLVRSGEALSALRAALAAAGPALREAVQQRDVGPDELVWVRERLGFPLRPVRREQGVKAEVRFIGDGSEARFQAAFLVPVRGAVEQGLLSLPAGADASILSLLAEMQASQARAIA